MINPSYLEAIRNKLDALNKAAGVDPSQKIQPGAVRDSNYSKYDPVAPDFLQAQGAAALKWMEQQKQKKSE